LDARLTTLLCEINVVAKSKEVKTGSNLAEPSKEGYGSERDVLPMIMIMIMMMIRIKTSAYTRQHREKRRVHALFPKWNSNPRS
jgi:hypothetical protein